VAMIEDDIELAQILEEFLNSHNIKVKNFDDPFVAISSLKNENFDALILDLTLPEIDGLEILKKIRQFSQIPIIISSARSDITDKIIGLELGADDYLPKPYNPRELEARLKAITRRAIKKEEKKEFYIDNDAKEIIFKENPLDLTPAEYEILKYFINNPNRVISREELIKKISLLSQTSSTKSIDVIIGRIRNKIEKDKKKPKYIISVRGIGYKFNG